MKTTLREANEWITLRWIDEKESIAAGLPRLLHIGDSIANGVSSQLGQNLKGKYGVDLFATSKIVCDVDYMSDLTWMLSRHRYDIIIFNNGLHGVEVNDADYAKGLFEVMTALLRLTPRLIWRTCTPCYGEENPLVEKSPLRNRIAKAEADKLGLPTLDVYSVLKDKPELVYDGIHFHMLGNELLAETICAFIQSHVACQEAVSQGNGNIQ